MQWFKNINTIRELKEKRNKLAKDFHPDTNPGTDPEIMADINMQYDEKYAELSGTKKEKSHEKKETAKPKARKIPKIELSDREQDELIESLTGFTKTLLKISAKKLFSVSSKK